MQEKIEGLMKEESIVNQYGVRVSFVGNLKLLSKPVRLAAERNMVATADNSKAVLSICIAYTSTDEILHAVQESCEEKLDEINSSEASSYGYGLLGLNGHLTRTWVQVSDTDVDPSVGLCNILKIIHASCLSVSYLSVKCPPGYGDEIEESEQWKGMGRAKEWEERFIDVGEIDKNMYVTPNPDIIIRTSGESRLSNFLLWQSSLYLLYSPLCFSQRFKSGTWSGQF